MIIAIDTNILIYAGMAPSNGAVDKEKHQRAKLFIYRTAKQGIQIVLSNISVSEVLVPVEPRAMGTLIQKLSKSFLIAPFETRSSAYAADIIARARKKPRQFQGYSRSVMVADAMIVASCKAAGAQEFYSNDTNALRLAKLAGMQAHDLPELHGDGDLFILKELEEGEI